MAALSVACCAAFDGADAKRAAAQDWPPFVLVAGLLLIGLVADGDGVFAAAGRAVSRMAKRELVLYAGAMGLVIVVTGVLNLDTSVAFLTPIFVYTARARGGGTPLLVYGCLLVSNAASTVLPGANLTNLIVLGDRHLSGARFFTTLAPAGLAAVLITAGVVAMAERHRPERAARPRAVTEADADADTRRDRAADVGTGGHGRGLGVAAVLAAAVVVLVLRAPALTVAGIGVAATGIRVAGRRLSPGRVLDALGVPVLVGLFGLAVALGTLGRSWSGPATALAHLDAFGTAGIGALSSVVVNNLPAASLLAARLPPRPLALLVGLDVGPNLFATGSLAWFLWYRAARGAGAAPSWRRAGRLGLLSAPVAMAAALAVLAATGGR